MKTFAELHGDREYNFYSGKLFELIVFDDYSWGKSQALLRYKEYNKFEGAFVELYGSTSSSTGTKSSYSFNNVWEEYIQKVDVWTMDDKAFVSKGSTSFEILNESDTSNVADAPVLELPHRRIIRFFYEFKDSDNKTSDTYVVVDKDEFHHNQPSNVYIGNNLMGYDKLTVNSDEMYRDGGTTNISTPKGKLYVPTPFNKGLIATWTYNDGVEHELERVEVDITNEHKVKMLHEVLNIKEDKLLKSE